MQHLSRDVNARKRARKSRVPCDYYRRRVSGCYGGASLLGHHAISVPCCKLRSPESETPGPRQSSTRTIDPLRALNSLLLRTSSPVSLSSSCCRLPAQASRLAALSLPLPGRAGQLSADISSPKDSTGNGRKALVASILPHLGFGTDSWLMRLPMRGTAKNNS